MLVAMVAKGFMALKPDAPPRPIDGEVEGASKVPAEHERDGARGYLWVGVDEELVHAQDARCEAEDQLDLVSDPVRRSRAILETAAMTTGMSTKAARPSCTTSAHVTIDSWEPVSTRALTCLGCSRRPALIHTTNSF